MSPLAGEAAGGSVPGVLWSAGPEPLGEVSPGRRDRWGKWSCVKVTKSYSRARETYFASAKFRIRARSGMCQGVAEIMKEHCALLERCHTDETL